MARHARRAVAAVFAIAAGAVIFLLSAHQWGRTETRRVRVKFDDPHGPRLLKLDGGTADSRLEYIPAPDPVFREARVGDEVVCTVRRIPEFELEAVDFRLSRDGREIGRWSDGTVFFWLACAALSLLAGAFACWTAMAVLRIFLPIPREAVLRPPTRIVPLSDEITPFAH